MGTKLKILFNSIRDNLMLGPVRAALIRRRDAAREYPNFLSVVAIMKNEAPYIKEWLDYHIAIGIDKFYLYDNESTDDIKVVLAPYIKSGRVEYKLWPGSRMQLQAYRDAVAMHKNDTKWLAFFDIDEFLMPSPREFLKKQSGNVAQVTLGCAIFGTNGHKTKPVDGLLSNFTRRGAISDECKSIVNPRLVRAIHSCHYSAVAGKTINACGARIAASRDADYPIDTFRVNHYKTKSVAECAAKFGVGDALYGARPMALEKYLEKYDQNEVLDKSICSKRK
ncbi:MAG: glycosyltransferase family 92 protein [Alphaproteobacteria bacterium]|nr:glycosyltransferase family 92 protein [Alphaproteobacteria bacterium]MCL2889979.1 glycosyltransferase family 92 protein [Alphaproteobacteria bacterium]